jgi:predicted O-methyltransferase YrrM
MQFDYPNWSTIHHGYWKKLLDSRISTDPFTMIEVGCFEGRSTVWFADYLKNNPKSLLLCLDSWTGGEEIDRLKLNYDMDVVETNFRLNINQHPYRNQIVTYKNSSEVSLSTLLYKGYQTIDFIYLDGSHTQRDTLVDLTLSLLLIKKGGIIIVDDYQNAMMTNVQALRPKAAVDFIVDSFGKEVGFSTTPEKQAVIIRK